MKPAFSVVVIARNEARTLPRLLDSLGEVWKRSGEILVLDTGSIDGTVRIAEENGCRVHAVGDRYRTIFDLAGIKEINAMFVKDGEAPILKAGDSYFDYSAARNYAASLASNDMIAMPDADEAYKTLDIDAINALIKEGVEQLEYPFTFAHDEWGAPLISFNHCKFYDRRKLSWKGIIHEVLAGSARRISVPAEVIALEHFQNSATDRSHYLRGLALDCYLNPKADRQSHYFGRELLWSGRPRSAIHELKRHIAMNGWRAERGQSMVFLGDALKQIGDTKGAIEAYHAAFAEDGTRREPLMRLARLAFENSDHVKTAVYASAALEIPPSDFYGNNQADYRHGPHELLYWALHWIGQKERAAEHWRKCIEYQPLNSRFLHDARFYVELPKVSIILPTLNRPEGLARCLASLKAINYPPDAIELIVIEDKPRAGVPLRVKEGFGKSCGAWIMFAADDTEFTPDSLIIAMLLGLRKNFKLVAFNTGDLLPDRGNICEHFIIRRDLVNESLGGEIFNTAFHHVGVDNFLWKWAEAKRHASRAENAIVHHYHFSRGYPMDDTYRLGWSKVEEDRKLLKELNAGCPGGGEAS